MACEGAREGARFALAFDTANEVVAVGVGRLVFETRTIEVAASIEVEARRASNTQLLARVDEALGVANVARGDIACVVVGRGPGSFTGVRIAMATAKGVASALGVGLIGVSSTTAVAWNAWSAGVRGRLLVVADAMRKEVYPARFDLTDAGAVRLDPDTVLKADAAAARYEAPSVTGDALGKYADLFASCGTELPRDLWTPTGASLLAAAESAWRAGEADPFDARRHDPAFALPVYTRLSDAEEAERARLADAGRAVPANRDLATGVQGGCARRPGPSTDSVQIVYRPLDAAHAVDVAALEAAVMGTDAWNELLVADELPRADRVWWAAYALPEGADADIVVGGAAAAGTLVGYAGAFVVDGDAQILKVGVDPAHRRAGIARELVSRVAAGARPRARSKCARATPVRRRSTRRSGFLRRASARGTIPTARTPSS